MTRNHTTRFIPKSAEEVRDESADAVVYLYGDGATVRLAAIGYHGKANKSDFHYVFKTAQQREKYIKEYFDGQRRRREFMAERRQARTSFRHSLKVGDILSGSWGYDQTNREFCQVVAITPGTVTIRPLAQHVTEATGFMSEMVVPVPDNFTGPEEIKRPVSSSGGPGAVWINEHCLASIWDGRPESQSHYA